MNIQNIRQLLWLTLLVWSSSCASGTTSETSSKEAESITEDRPEQAKATPVNQSESNTTKSNQMTNESPYEGLYVSAGSHPRLYVLTSGQFYMYKKTLNEDLPTGYYYQRDLVTTFSVKDENLISPDYGFGAHFIKNGDEVIAMEDKFVKTVKVKALKDIFAKNEWDAKPLLNDLVSNHAVSMDDAKGLFIREDLWDSISGVDYGDKTKINMRELALNYINGKFKKVERVTGANAYDGVYGFEQNGGANISRILVVKNSRFAWFDVFWDTAGGTKNGLIFRPITTMYSGGPVEIANGKYSYTRDRYKGQFIITDGQVTGVTEGVVEYVKYPTVADMIKLNPAMDARELLTLLMEKHGMDADMVKNTISSVPFVDLFEEDQLTQRMDFSVLIKQ